MLNFGGKNKMKQKNIRFEYLKNLFYAVVRKIVGINRFKRKKYYAKKILDPRESNQFIFDSINNNKRFFIARLGDVECRLLMNQEQVNYHLIKRVPDKIRTTAFKNAGMFSTDDQGIETFFNYYTSGMKHITGLCVWFNQMEDYLADKYAANATLLSLDGLESYLYEKPWTTALKGKKVLVVSPFADTIEKQFRKRELLFKSKETIPLFDLKTYKSFYTLPGEKIIYDKWETVLQKMKEDCLKIDFDIAILGCGSYGLALGSLLFEAGKNVIHAGGVTQIYFGIKGKRWEKRKYMSEFFNEYWVRPSEKEKPKSSNNIEEGCYW